MYGVLSFIFFIVSLFTIGEFNKFIALLIVSALFGIADSILSYKFENEDNKESKTEK